ncbi:hypothetical protein ABPG72_011271 [Tetrahymena utriculariae]
MGRLKQKLLKKRQLKQQKQKKNPIKKDKGQIRKIENVKEKKAEQQKKKDQKGKDDDDSRNALEKIIKLDKKNSNFDLYDSLTNNFLKVRSVNYQINYQQIQGLSQTDHQMRQFWRHVNSTYLRRVQSQDENKLEYLKNLLNTPLEPENLELEWDDWRAQLAVQYILDESVQRQYQDDELSNLNYENLILHMRITFLIANQYLKDKSLIQKIVQTKKKQIPKNQSSYQNQLEAFQSEKNKLLQIIQNITQNSQLYKEILEEEDQLLNETVKLKEELKQINQQNHKNIQRLEQQLKMEFCKQQMIYLETDYTLPKSKNENGNIQKDYNEEQKHLLLEKHFAKMENMNLQAQFLHQTILRLEKKQLSETISCITGYTNKQNQPQFELRFESAYNNSTEWVSEQLLDELNSLRDQNLFSFYNIPQKTLYSHIANNFLGWNYIQKNRDKPNQLKLKNIKEIITQKEQIGNKMNQYEICHHCKHLFKKSILFQCKYKSSTMGIPVHNYIVTDPFLFQFIESENTNSKKPQVNKKRNCYTMFQKVDGDLVCKRMYCRSCLKQNYDLILSEIKEKQDWLCPFCQGNCYCTRCLRNELLMKYKGIYILLGGDINLIQRESVFEYYSQQMSQQRQREYQEQQQNMNSRGMKNSVKGLKLKDEHTQKIVEVERLKQLCQLVNKREKYKFEMLKQNIDIFREKYKSHTEKEFPLVDLNNLNTQEFIADLLPFHNELVQNTINNSQKNNQILGKNLIKNSNNKIKMIQINKLFKKKNKKQKNDDENNTQEENSVKSYTSQNSSSNSQSQSQSSVNQNLDEKANNIQRKKAQSLKINKLIKKTKTSSKSVLKKSNKKGNQRD